MGVVDVFCFVKGNCCEGNCFDGGVGGSVGECLAGVFFVSTPSGNCSVAGVILYEDRSRVTDFAWSLLCLSIVVSLLFI